MFSECRCVRAKTISAVYSRACGCKPWKSTLRQLRACSVDDVHQHYFCLSIRRQEMRHLQQRQQHNRCTSKRDEEADATTHLGFVKNALPIQIEEEVPAIHKIQNQI